MKTIEVLASFTDEHKTRYRKGETREVSEKLGGLFIEKGLAQEVEPPAEENPPERRRHKREGGQD